MAWNEPGGGNRDPWGGNRNDKGPPDLDEVFKNLQSKLGGIFGRRGGGNGSGGGSGGGRISSIGGTLIIVVALIAWMASGIYLIQPAERGVVTQFGRYVATTTPGPHWHLPWPIQSVEKVNVDQIRSVLMRKQSMLTRDENIVEIDLSVQYNIKSAEDFLFRVRNPDATLQQVAESAIREVIGGNDMDFIITQGRDAIAAGTKERAQITLDDYSTGLFLTTVNLEAAQPPEPVQAAFSDAIKAREDEQRFINEAEAYANEIIPRARGDAREILEQSKGYRTRVTKSAEGEANRFTALLREYEKAPGVTRDRLYIDAVESVLSRSSKVLVDVESGNTLMYLPLDKLINRDGVTAGDDMRNFRRGSSTPLPTPEAQFTPSASRLRNDDGSRRAREPR